MRKNKNLIVFFLMMLTCTVAFSSWVILTDKNTSDGETIKDDEHTVSIFTRQYKTRQDAVIEYFVPNEFTNHYNITYKLDESGSPITSKIVFKRSTDTKASASNVGCSLSGAKENEDEIVQYYDNNIAINQRYNRSIDWETNNPFKSYYTDVQSWSKVSNSEEYKSVWKACIDKSETPDGKGNLTADSNKGIDTDHYYIKIQGSSGNTMSGHGPGNDNCPNVGDTIFTCTKPLKTIERTEGSKKIVEDWYGRIVCFKVDEVVYSNKVSYKMPACNNYSTTSYASWYYYPDFQLRMVRTTTETSEYEENSFEKKFVVKHNGFIKAKDLEIAGYDTCAFYSDPTYEHFFDFKTPITSDINLYVKEYPTDNQLTDYIGNNTGTIQLYDSMRGGNGDSNDSNILSYSNYDEDSKSIFVKNTTIKSGATVNLTFGNSEVINGNINGTDDNASAYRSADQSAALDYNGNNEVGFNPSIYMLLSGDLTVKGTLQIGAKIGGHNTSRRYYSYITETYACLDLYGHNIIVDGGTLNCYGVIKDSVGGGKIIVKNNGTVLGTLSVSDGNSRDQNVIGLRYRQFPFSEYKFNYIQVPVVLSSGCSLRAFIRFDATLNICNATFNVIGPYNSDSSKNSVISWDNSNADETITFEPYQITELSNKANNTIYKQMYNWRNRFIIDANVRTADSMTITFQAKISTYTLSLTADFARYDFPVSPFFDFVIKQGRVFSVYSKMTMFPGSMLYVEKGSTIHFKDVGDKSYPSYESAGFGIQSETRHIAGGIMTYTNRLISNYYVNYSNGILYENEYWKYNKINNVVIDGTCLFDPISSQSSDAYYYISGEINLSNDALQSIRNNKNYIRTYDFKGLFTNGFLYDNGHTSSEYFYEYAVSYNCNPLISGTKSFIIDKSRNYEGEYDTSSGLFKSNSGENIILLPTTNMMSSGSGKGDTSGTIDKTLDVKIVTEAYEDIRVVKIDSAYYVYYSGIYIPIIDDAFDCETIKNDSIINVNERKFMSNKDAESMKSITKNVKHDISSSTYSYDSGNGLSYQSIADDTNYGVQVNYTSENNTIVNVNFYSNNRGTISVNNASLGEVTMTLDSGVNSYTKNISDSTNFTITDNISSNNTLIVNTKFNNKNLKATVVYRASSLTITIDSEIDGAATKVVYRFNGSTIDITSSGFSSNSSTGLSLTKNILTSKETDSRVNISPLFDRCMLKFNSTTKTWQHYGFTDKPKDTTKDVYYTY